MIFNPLFIGENGNIPTLIQKPGKLAGNKYLFSDIVKVVLNPATKDISNIEKNITEQSKNLKLGLENEQKFIQLKYRLLTDKDSEQVKLDLADILPVDIAQLLVNEEFISDENNAVSYISKEPLKGELQNFLNNLIGSDIIEKNINHKTGLLLNLEDNKSAVNIEMVKDSVSKNAGDKIIVQTLVVPEKSKLLSVFSNNNLEALFRTSGSTIDKNTVSNQEIRLANKNSEILKPTLSVYSFSYKGNEFHSLTKEIKSNYNFKQNLNLLSMAKDKQAQIVSNKITFTNSNLETNQLKNETATFDKLKAQHSEYVKNNKLKIVNPANNKTGNDYSVSKITIVKKQDGSSALETFKDKNKISAKENNTSFRLIDFNKKPNDPQSDIKLINKLKNGEESQRIFKLNNNLTEDKVKAPKDISIKTGSVNTQNSKNISSVIKNLKVENIKSEYIEQNKGEPKQNVINKNLGNIETKVSNSQVNDTNTKNVFANSINESNLSGDKNKNIQSKSNVNHSVDKIKDFALKDESLKTGTKTEPQTEKTNIKLNNEKINENKQNTTVESSKSIIKESSSEKNHSDVKMDKNSEQNKINNEKPLNKDYQKSIIKESSSEKGSSEIKTDKSDQKNKINNDITLNKDQQKTVNVNQEKLINNSKNKIDNTPDINSEKNRTEINDKLFTKVSSETENMKPESKQVKSDNKINNNFSQNEKHNSTLNEKSETSINKAANEKENPVKENLNNRYNSNADKNSNEPKPVSNINDERENNSENKISKQNEKQQPENALNTETEKKLKDNKKISLKVKGGIKSVSNRNESVGNTNNEKSPEGNTSDNEKNKSDNNEVKLKQNPNTLNESFSKKMEGESNFSQILNKNGVNQISTAETKSLFKESNSTSKFVQSAEIIKEISRFISKQQKGSLSFDIKPEHLGKMKITLDTVDKMLKASIEVDNEQARQLVEKNIDKLQQQLSNNGLQLNSLNISLSYSKQQKEGKKINNKTQNETQNPGQVGETEEKNNKKQLGYNTYEYIA